MNASLPFWCRVRAFVFQKTIQRELLIKHQKLAIGFEWQMRIYLVARATSASDSDTFRFYRVIAVPLNAESPSLAPLSFSWFSHLPIINRRNFRHLNRHQTLFIGFRTQIYWILLGWVEKKWKFGWQKVKFRLICGTNVRPTSPDTPCQIELQ